VPAYSPSYEWAITVHTDRPYYYIGDRVYINGAVSYGGQGRGPLDVAIVVRLSSSANPYCLGTSTTDDDGEYSFNFGLGGLNAELGEYVVNVTASTPDHMPCSNQTTFKLINAIYIRAGGEVEPAEAPISRNGEVYSLTGNIPGNAADGIVIERSNIILDGAGFTVNGTNLVNSNGINLASVDNVTVRNISVRFFGNGIFENLCHGCQILETNLSSNGYGIHYQQSHFNTIEGNNITKNTYGGILLDAGSDNNIISKNRLANTVSSNLIGAISLRGFSNNNGIFDNNFVSNTLYGIYIEGSYSNSIFHNNFVSNTIQAYVVESTGNSWDNGYPSGGNYWSNYAGVDEKNGPNQNLPGSDNIGDTVYTIDSNNKDNYPLMNSWNPTSIIVNETSIIVNGVPYSVTTATNATITQFDSTPNNLNFTATGAPGTKGYLLIIVPKGANTTELKVLVNGTELTSPPPVINENTTHYFIYCELHFSTLQVLILFVIPTGPFGALSSVASMTLALAVHLRMRKRRARVKS
jgi:parallel beta-helix repeat protein